MTMAIQPWRVTALACAILKSSYPLTAVVAGFSFVSPRRPTTAARTNTPTFLSLLGTTSSTTTAGSTTSRTFTTSSSSTLKSSATEDKNEEATTEQQKEAETPTTTPQQPKGVPRHDVRGSGDDLDEIDPEEADLQKRFMEHQQDAPKLGWETDIRTLVEYNHGFAVMSTNSKSNPGYPGGSVVGFAPDDKGRPVFVFSGMSTHTQDVLADPKCSVTIASKEFKGAADGRVNLMGRCTLLPKEEIESAKALYLKKHPGAFWVNFGDFNWFRLDVDAIRFVGGFARAGSITPQEYADAKPDPISQFGMAIAQHMNEDHMSSTIAMIEKAIPGMDVTDATITSVDSLGMYVKVGRTPRASDQPQQFKLRLPFPRPALDRKDVRTIIVEMTQEAAAAAKTAGGDEKKED